MKERGGRLILVVRIFVRYVSVQSLLYFLSPVLFSVDIQERHRQLPDVGRGEQIVCDKRIVGADELFAKRELRDIFLTAH